MCYDSLGDNVVKRGKHCRAEKEKRQLIQQTFTGPYYGADILL